MKILEPLPTLYSFAAFTPWRDHALDPFIVIKFPPTRHAYNSNVDSSEMASRWDLPMSRDHLGPHFQLNFWLGVLQKPHVKTPADGTFYSRVFSAATKAKLKTKFAAWEVKIQEISSSLSRTLVNGGEREIGACFLAKLQKNFQSEIKIPANKTSVVGAFAFFGCARKRKVLKV